MRTAIVAASAATVAIVAGGAGVALAQPHHAAATGTVRVSAHSVVDRTLDLGKKGFSVGDQELESARLTRGTSGFGTVDGVCEATLATRSVAHELCSNIFALPHGLITTAGEVTSSPSGPGPFDWAITGGTGRYAKARGYVHVIPGNGPTIQMTIHVTR